MSISYLDFYNKLDSMEEKEYIENFLIYNTSLVIAGVKPAITITLKKNNKKVYKNWIKFGADFLKEIDLNFIDLRENDESIILLIYDECILYKELSQTNNTKFLRKLGYKDIVDSSSYIKTLKSRYKLYKCPHELGLFLGIPFEDVKDFIECSDKKCIMCKYWKVYNDSEKAEIIFNQYDKVKEYTQRKITDGIISHNLVLLIKEYAIDVV